MTPKKTSHKPAKPQASAADHVTVRMYNVGFGDAFLVFIPTPQGRRKILFDCGTRAAGPMPIRKVAERIAADATDPDGKARIDVVVATHRHQDHVSGFDDAVWEEVQVQEVWMPWTEDPNDPQATRIRETQSGLAKALSQSLERRLQAVAAGSAEYQTTAGLYDLAQNALTNEDAMRTLHEGFEGNPKRRYLPTPQAEEQTFQSTALPGVTVHIMGPSRDEDIIRDMDPPGGTSYLNMIDSAPNDEGQVPDPFNEDWWLDNQGLPTVDLDLSPQDRNAIEEVSRSMEPGLAVALEQAVNGTSLMLLMQIGKSSLLFPGDAQWGTWHAALENAKWQGLMKRTTFYKVGHHGSHNATPKQFVEQTVQDGFWGMVSVKPVRQWPNIPKRELWEAMEQKTAKLVRSDEEENAPSEFKVEPGIYIETQIPI